MRHRKKHSWQLDCSQGINLRQASILKGFIQQPQCEHLQTEKLMLPYVFSSNFMKNQSCTFWWWQISCWR